MSSQERALRVAQQQIATQRMVKTLVNNELAELRAENEQLRANIKAAVALHVPNDDVAPMCWCDEPWPCETLKALGMEDKR